MRWSEAPNETIERINLKIFFISPPGETVVNLREEFGVRGHLRRALIAGVGVALAAGLAYPVIAGYQFTSVYSPRHWQDLNGIAYVGE